MKKNKRLGPNNVDTKIELKVFLIQEFISILKNWRLMLKLFIFVTLSAIIFLILFADIRCKTRFFSFDKKPITLKETTK